MSIINLDSYPPTFRPLGPPPPPPSAAETEDDAFDPIPVIDFQALMGKSDEKARLAEACREWGVFRVVNHGVPETLLTRLEDEAGEVFSRPFEAKKGVFAGSALSYFWGTPALTRAGAALSTGPKEVNWVEGINVPLSQLSHQSHPILSSLSLLLEQYGKRVGELATAIFEALSEDLNLDTADTESNLSESTGFVRVYRYPCYSGDRDDGRAWGMSVHTDSSVLSVLKQDQVGGLEVLRDDRWFSVKPISNTLIVNLGDMMQAMSDDKYKSVKHRVKVNKREERVSICYFVFPGEGSVISSSKYRPFTYADFQAQSQSDIKAFGCKVGLERFKLLTDDSQ